MSRKKIITFLVFLCLSNCIYSQGESVTFDFNEGKIKEKEDKIAIKSLGINFVDDRFGNSNSAIYIQGHETSYLNLGTSKFFKQTPLSISLWVNIGARVFYGKGFDHNPILVLRNGNEAGFDMAISMGIIWANKRLAVGSNLDSLKEVALFSLKEVEFNHWYHIVVVCNDDYMSFYIDGQLQSKTIKNFKTKFLETDSLMFGYNQSPVHRRYTLGAFDDIKIFHKSLSDDEVMQLYKEPNPNRIKKMLRESVNYLVIVLLFVVIIIIITYRNKAKLKRQKEKMEVEKKMSELELKVVKSQMNPHFISNCMSAIQDLIYKQKIEEAVLYVSKFSFFLRLALRYSDKNYITLEKEIEVIALYVELEQLRFKNKFDFILNVEEGIKAEDIEIPSLITQPFIENAIWHGLIPLEGLRPPSLKIKIFTKQDNLIIEIEDNGVGRARLTRVDAKGVKLIQEKLESLNKLSDTSLFKLETIDLTDSEGNKLGTKVVITVLNSLSQ